MSVMTFLRPLPVTVAASTLTDPQRVLTADPKEVAFQTATGAFTLDLDLGSAQLVSGVFLGGLSAAAAFQISGGLAGYTETNLGAIAAAPKFRAKPPYKSIRVFPEENWRFIRISAAIAGAGLEVGNVIVGDAFQPTWGHEWGAGRGIGDTGTSQRLLSGGFGINRGVRFKTWDWTLGDLTDDEIRELTDLCLEVGETSPLVICEDPDQTTGLDERLYYGKFAKIERYERLIPGATRWSFKVEEWV